MNERRRNMERERKELIYKGRKFEKAKRKKRNARKGRGMTEKTKERKENGIRKTSR